jgi:hypothetical protein
MNLNERLDKIEDIIKNPVFRQNKGLGNEVNYRIFDYDPRQELEVRNYITYLKDKMNHSNVGFRVIEFDLWEVMLNILKKEDYYDAFWELEEENDFQYVAESLVETLGLDETDEQNLIVTYIVEHAQPGSILFLTGIGKCFPIIQSHNILNNLHQVLDDVPVIMFFPGQYNGQELKLFNTVESQNYYRAFKLI